MPVARRRRSRSWRPLRRSSPRRCRAGRWPGARGPGRCRPAARSSGRRGTRRRSGSACGRRRGRGRRVGALGGGVIPAMPIAQMSATIRIAPARPTTNPSSRPRPSESPRSVKKLCRSCARLLNSAPSLAPSNAVLPTETISTAIVPSTGVSLAAPVNGTRRYRRPLSARRPSGESEPIRPNRTPNASALRVQRRRRRGSSRRASR